MHEKGQNRDVLEKIATEVFEMPPIAVDGFIASCVYLILQL